MSKGCTETLREKGKDVSDGHPAPLGSILLHLTTDYATRLSFLIILKMKSAATRQMHIRVPHTT